MSLYDELTAKGENHYQCHYCGIRHKMVEAGGIWHCPNLICTGPGAAWFRARLRSYKDQQDGRHVVDTSEWLIEAFLFQKSPENKHGHFVMKPHQESGYGKVWYEI